MKNYGCKIKDTLIIENQMIVQETSNEFKKEFLILYQLKHFHKP